MSKLTIFTGTLSHGGSERVISILSEAFVEKYNEVEIILFYDMPIWYEINNKIKVINIEKNIGGKKSLLKKALWLRRYIKKNKPDICISFLAPFNMFAIISLLGINVPIIVSERNDPRHIPSKYSMRIIRNILYSFADKIIVQTENNKVYFNKKIQEKTSIIYNPIFIGELAGSALTTLKEKKIVTVGRLIKQKNQKMLIEAFKNIHNEYKNYKLIIYGEGDLRKELKELINIYNMQDHIELAGVKQNIFSHISDAELFVLTSEFEGMPNALIEAMCLGLPCISTKVSGAVDLIENGVNGILIENGDILELENAIKTILNNNEYSYELGKNASLIKKNLSINSICERWICEINKLNKL